MQESINDSPTKSIEICHPTMVRRIAAMLDLETHSYSNGDVLPRGWHFFLLAGETQKSALRQDGFPGLGVPMPDLGLPRLLLGGRSVVYNDDILIGSEVERTSFVKNITEKTTQSGRMAIVNIQHELRPFLATNPAIVETQTYILLEEKKSQTTSEKPLLAPIKTEYQKTFIPDETLLFQYSALVFNSHKIHLDKEYARNVEGFPDLVVNGGLATLLLTEFVRAEIGFELTEVKVKHTAPLFCGHTLTLAAERGKTLWQLKIFDNNNTLAVEMEATIK
jgi:3-methylfumaryl-CoA hydratase